MADIARTYRRLDHGEYLGMSAHDKRQYSDAAKEKK